MLAEFDFEVVHRPGKSNVVADAVSKLNSVQVGAASREHHMKDLFKGLEQAYKNEKETNTILQTWMCIGNSVAPKINCIIQGMVECNCTFPWGSFGISLCKSATISAMLDIWACGRQRS